MRTESEIQAEEDNLQFWHMVNKRQHLENRLILASTRGQRKYLNAELAIVYQWLMYQSEYTNQENKLIKSAKNY